MAEAGDDSFELYDLRVEVTAPEESPESSDEEESSLELDDES